MLFVVVQSLSHVGLFATPWTAACQSPLSSTVSWSLLKFMSFELVLLSNHLILFRPLFLLPSVFPSIRVFSNELALHFRWLKCWSFSFRMNPSNEYSGLISFRIDGLDLLVIQGTLKNLFQHHDLKASILQHSAAFMVQLSYPYRTTEKTITLTVWTFVGKVMSLLYNTLSRFVLSFPGSSVVKNLPANSGGLDLIPGSGRYPGGEHGNPLQYSCLDNPMDRGGLQSMVP